MKIWTLWLKFQPVFLHFFVSKKGEKIENFRNEAVAWKYLRKSFFYSIPISFISKRKKFLWSSQTSHLSCSNDHMFLLFQFNMRKFCPLIFVFSSSRTLRLLLVHKKNISKYMFDHTGTEKALDWVKKHTQHAINASETLLSGELGQPYPFALWWHYWEPLPFFILCFSASSHLLVYYSSSFLLVLFMARTAKETLQRFWTFDTKILLKL